MPAIKDITGQVFGRLTALRCVGRNKRSDAVWLCQCTCGTETEVLSSNVIKGGTQSCGCLSREMTVARNRAQAGEKHPSFKHGHASNRAASIRKSPTWASWGNTLTRCSNPKNIAWKYYGGAPVPIQICEGLREFTGFLAVLGERPKGTTLGRFGDVGNYSCGQCEQCKQNGWELNCTWQTKREQAAEQKAKFAMVGRKPTEHKTTPAQRSAIHRKSGHTRWHTRRNIVKIDCLYCVPVVESQAA
jgi:hypothetical protein